MLNFLRSSGGRDAAQNAIGQSQVHTFHPAQHHKSDNGRQVHVLE
jgi:hypothetical protein